MIYLILKQQINNKLNQKKMHLDSSKKINNNKQIKIINKINNQLIYLILLHNFNNNLILIIKYHNNKHNLFTTNLRAIKINRCIFNNKHKLTINNNNPKIIERIYLIF